MAKNLYKTVIVVWSEYNPAATDIESSELVRDGECGDSYISSSDTVFVEDPSKDSDWDGTEFFNGGWDDEEVDDE